MKLFLSIPAAFAALALTGCGDPSAEAPTFSKNDVPENGAGNSADAEAPAAEVGKGKSALRPRSELQLEPSGQQQEQNLSQRVEKNEEFKVFVSYKDFSLEPILIRPNMTILEVKQIILEPDRFNFRFDKFEASDKDFILAFGSGGPYRAVSAGENSKKVSDFNLKADDKIRVLSPFFEISVVHTIPKPGFGICDLGGLDKVESKQFSVRFNMELLEFKDLIRREFFPNQSPNMNNHLQMRIGDTVVTSEDAALIADLGVAQGSEIHISRPFSGYRVKVVHERFDWETTTKDITVDLSTTVPQAKELVRNAFNIDAERSLKFYTSRTRTDDIPDLNGCATVSDRRPLFEQLGFTFSVDWNNGILQAQLRVTSHEPHFNINVHHPNGATQSISIQEEMFFSEVREMIADAFRLKTVLNNEFYIFNVHIPNGRVAGEDEIINAELGETKTVREFFLKQGDDVSVGFPSFDVTVQRAKPDSSWQSTQEPSKTMALSCDMSPVDLRDAIQREFNVEGYQIIVRDWEWLAGSSLLMFRAHRNPFPIRAIHNGQNIQDFRIDLGARDFMVNSLAAPTIADFKDHLADAFLLHRYGAKVDSISIMRDGEDPIVLGEDMNDRLVEDISFQQGHDIRFDIRLLPFDASIFHVARPGRPRRRNNENILNIRLDMKVGDVLQQYQDQFGNGRELEIRIDDRSSEYKVGEKFKI